MKTLTEYIMDLDGEISTAKTEERAALNLLLEAQSRVDAAQSLKEKYGMDKVLYFEGHRDYYKAQYDQVVSIIEILETQQKQLLHKRDGEPDNKPDKGIIRNTLGAQIGTWRNS